MPLREPRRLNSARNVFIAGILASNHIHPDQYRDEVEQNAASLLGTFRVSRLDDKLTVIRKTAPSIEWLVALANASSSSLVGRNSYSDVFTFPNGRYSSNGGNSFPRSVSQYYHWMRRFDGLSSGLGQSQLDFAAGLVANEGQSRTAGINSRRNSETVEKRCPLSLARHFCHTSSSRAASRPAQGR